MNEVPKVGTGRGDEGELGVSENGYIDSLKTTSLETETLPVSRL